MNYTEKMKQKELKTKEVSQKLSKVLEDFAKENGLNSLRVGNFTINEEGFTTKLEAKFELDQEEEKVLFNRKAIRMGLREGLYKEELTIRGDKFTIVDINTKAPINSIIVKGEDGKSYSLRSETFKKDVCQ